MPAVKSTAAQSRPELLETIEEVLEFCGLTRDNLPWDFELVNQLPNFRLQRKTKSPYRSTAWLFPTDRDNNDTNLADAGRLHSLPSLESLTEAFLAKSPKNPKGTIYKGRELLENKDGTYWRRTIKGLQTGNVKKERIVDLYLDGILDETSTRPFHRRVKEIIAMNYPDMGDVILDDTIGSVNITPRLTCIEMHHDSKPTISVAIGRGAKAVKNRPLKLWLLWSSTEINRLGYGDTYANTNEALRTMNHGSFWVQMDGDELLVPPNTPHAVFTLNDSYIYGHSFSAGARFNDPTTVLADMKAGIALDEALDTRVRSLERCADTKHDFDRHVESLVQNWTAEGPYFKQKQHSKLFARLVRVFARAISKNDECELCNKSPLPPDSVDLSSLKTHVLAHFGIIEDVKSKSKPRTTSTSKKRHRVEEVEEDDAAPKAPRRSSRPKRPTIRLR